MIDIVTSEPGKDLGIYDTQVERAKNILSVQINRLEYAKGVGIDLKYFLSEDLTFQNASFQAYTVEILASWGINVSSLIATDFDLFSQYVYNLAPEETSTGLVAR